MSNDPDGRVLRTMEPATDWDRAAHESAVETLSDERLTFHVWGGDWCPDCREQLPALAAALDAAGVPDERLTVYPVERTNDGKTGPKMDAFDVDLIPTVVVRRDGTECARIVERAPLSLPVALAHEIAEE